MILSEMDELVKVYTQLCNYQNIISYLCIAKYAEYHDILNTSTSVVNKLGIKFTENEILNSPNKMFSCVVGLPDYICV